MHAHNFQDLTGKRFGKLVVLGKFRYDPVKQRSFWRVQCDCGTIKEVTATNMRSRGTISCGCHRKALISISNKKHGMFGTPVYESWGSMIQRCTNPNYQKYKNYGGRGITICARWRNSFQAFYEDMGDRPKGTTLNRIDNEGNYEPGNCNWATPKEQASNTRTNRFITLIIDGVAQTKTVTQWCEELNLNSAATFKRIYDGWDPTEALTKPKMKNQYG